MNVLSTMIVIIFLTIVSPGPDLTMVIRNSLIYSRRTGLYTALGVAVSDLIHASYNLIGFGILIIKYDWLLDVVKYLGSTYFIYLGIQGLRAKDIEIDDLDKVHKKDISIKKAFALGLMNSLLNPKAILFYISLFSLVIPKETQVQTQILYLFVIFIEVLLWFGFVAFVFSNGKIKEKFLSINHWVERISGGILIALGIKLFFSNMRKF